MKRHTKTLTIGESTLTFETGKIARQADGAVLLRVGDTVLMSTVCASAEPLENVDFLPLRIDYQEKFSSAGKTPGGFFKREGRPTQKETLVSRLIDRPIRPMIADGYYHDIQIINYVLSYDNVHPTEPLAICATSAALTLSSVPLVHPIAAVRVGLVDDKFLINPSVEQMKKSRLDLMLAGSEDAILMIEGFCDLLTEEEVINAVEVGHSAIREICATLREWRDEIGKPKKLDTLHAIPQEVTDAVKNIAGTELEPALRIQEKAKREAALSEIKEKVMTSLTGEEVDPQYEKLDVASAFKKLSAEIMRNIVLNEKVRADGRGLKDIRPIDIEQSLLPRTHGSSLFTRGETQSIAVCTLGGENMAQRYEYLTEEGTQRFYLQYTFPPFSVGEIGRVGAPGRREVGHGKLAERSLEAVLPSRDDFPYTIRIESNITESNGSSSMASVCGGCLAMLDAGVPLKAPVAGIAMGLILEKDKHAILSDILGIEDALGDMDFKVAGTAEGISSFQMDIKVEGITQEIMEEALAQAKEGRLHILSKMNEACPKPQEMSIYAPRIETVKISPSKIGAVVGPGGKQIRAIIEETGVEIDIDDTGLVSISSPSFEGIERAKEIIHSLTAEVEVGRTYKGKITSVVPFGIFVEVLPGKEGLCHISEFAHERTNDLNDVVKPGEMVTVKVIDINERGQLKLSRKATLATT